MALTRTILPSIISAEGRINFGPFAVPLNVVNAEVILDRTQHLNPGVQITIQLEVSYDNGATWPPGGATSTFGGVAFGDRLPDGTRPVENDFQFSTTVQQPANNQRKIRGYIENTGGSFTSSGGHLDLTSVD